MNAAVVATGLATAGAGIALLIAGLYFWPSEALIGPASLALVLSGLAIASKGV